MTESRIDSDTDRRRADPSLTVTVALAAVVPLTLFAVAHPAFVVGALTGTLAVVAARR